MTTKDEAISTERAMKLALETSEGIVNADWRKWDELASPSEFERWAKSRANFMATILREALNAPLAEQPAQRTWVGLTEQEAAECWSTSTVRTWQAIEAKLKEKNNG